VLRIVSYFSFAKQYRMQCTERNFDRFEKSSPCRRNITVLTAMYVHESARHEGPCLHKSCNSDFDLFPFLLTGLEILGRIRASL
jgi:hypothetical protein